jgi:hypothetical protein
MANTPSKAVLQETFGTSNVTEVIESILKEGDVRPATGLGKRGARDRGTPGLIQPCECWNMRSNV